MNAGDIEVRPTRVIASRHADIVAEVQEAVARHPVVVVGMKQNPHPRRARKALDAKGTAYHYLEYGSYFGAWANAARVRHDSFAPPRGLHAPGSRAPSTPVG